jgi:hypothetical protein
MTYLLPARVEDPPFVLFGHRPLGLTKQRSTYCCRPDAISLKSSPDGRWMTRFIAVISIQRPVADETLKRSLRGLV